MKKLLFLAQFSILWLFIRVKVLIMTKKVRINEGTLTRIIAESTRRAISEYLLEAKIRKAVRESIESMGDFSQFEESDEDGEKAERKPIHNPDGTSDMNNETKDEEELRDEVEGFFKSRGVNIAPYAYKLYGVEDTKGEDTNDMKNARSKFAKCLNHEPNENGYPYSFDSSEINSLHSYISSGTLSEGAVKKKKSLKR